MELYPVNISSAHLVSGLKKKEIEELFSDLGLRYIEICLPNLSYEEIRQCTIILDTKNRTIKIYGGDCSIGVIN